MHRHSSYFWLLFIEVKFKIIKFDTISNSLITRNYMRSRHFSLFVLI